ncbi:MAG: septum formation initiator family protein [Clostridia bacterium]|nr:septum formation initiator family protein [Clostridia bacterium]
MNKIIKRLIFLGLIIYAIYIFIAQQKMLNSYAVEKNEYTNQIINAEEEKAELSNSLQGINSTDYIEDAARNKLDMYLPNERVYIDITK